MKTFRNRLIVALFGWAIIMLVGSYVGLSNQAWFSLTSLILVMTGTFGFERIVQLSKRNTPKE